MFIGILLLIESSTGVRIMPRVPLSGFAGILLVVVSTGKKSTQGQEILKRTKCLSDIHYQEGTFSGSSQVSVFSLNTLP